jgi:hypothetical protein
MGCDIHLFIEHKRKDSKYWSSFGGEINPGRDYEIFARLAGVRNRLEEEITPVAPNRGLPEGTSYIIKDENTLWIDDDTPEYEGHCSSCKALSWIEQGISKMDGEHRITHPDWHSHSWCTTDELQKVLMDCEYVDSEWKVVLKASMYFEELGEEVRLVFWFDN